MIIGALNINSIRNIFPNVEYILGNDFIDSFSILERKLDNSFPDSQFHVKGYNLFLQDSTSSSGGIITWVRNDLTNCRRYDFEINDVNTKSLCLEINVQKEKWFIVSVYSVPRANANGFIESLSLIPDQVFWESKMINIIGDMNVNMNAHDSKSANIQDFLTM